MCASHQLKYLSFIHYLLINFFTSRSIGIIRTLARNFSAIQKHLQCLFSTHFSFFDIQCVLSQYGPPSTSNYTIHTKSTYVCLTDLWIKGAGIFRYEKTSFFENFSDNFLLNFLHYILSKNFCFEVLEDHWNHFLPCLIFVLPWPAFPKLKIIYSVWCRPKWVKF